MTPATLLLVRSYGANGELLDVACYVQRHARVLALHG